MRNGVDYNVGVGSRSLDQMFVGYAGEKRSRPRIYATAFLNDYKCMSVFGICLMRNLYITEAYIYN